MALALLLLAILALAPLPAWAAPPANAVIGNQASATYTDASGLPRMATSNMVETTVKQVGSLALVQDNSKTAAIGNTVYMPHTVTNNGNGSDSFVLSTADIAAATDTDFATGIAIYADANGDGVPDSTTPLCTGLACTTTTPSLPAGGSFSFVVAMTVPVGTAAGAVDQIVVTATGSNAAIYDGDNNGVFGEPGDNVKSNTDSLTVTAGAAFQVSKSVSASQGPTGVVLTYTLTYQNIGAAAGNLALNDVIGSGLTVGQSYVAGSAIWSAGATALTDAYTVGAPDATVGANAMHYRAATVGTVTTIDATLTNVAPNVTGSVRFQVNVLGTATVGSSSTTNTARFGLDADADPTNNTLTQATNPSPYTVLPTYGLVLNDSTAAAADGANVRPAVADIDAPANPDLKRIATASPGQVLSFESTVWNTGNTTDSFNVAAALMAGGSGYGAWPAGTTVQLFKADGVTPLTDSNGDGVPDTGALAAGASQAVLVRISLPSNACTPSCPVGPFDAQVTATSVADPSKSNTSYDRLGALVAPTVDLANSAGAVDATVNQDAVGPVPTVTQATTAGGSAVFNLVVRNEGSVADTYVLAVSGTNAFTPATALPPGYTVQFRTAVAGVCSATGGTVLSAVGPVSAGTEAKVCAIVTAPLGAPAGNTELYFQVQSQTTGAVDAVHDRITVSEISSLTIQPSHTNQVYPGGTVTYPFTLNNSGNTSCGPGFTFTLLQSFAAQGWTVVLYHDVNGDGAIDAGDTVIVPATGISGTTLAPGASVKLVARVFAPAGAAMGSTDLVSLTANGLCGATTTTTNTATAATTVITAQVRLVKTQAIDHNCDGTPSLPSPDPAARATGAAYSVTAMQALPGECIVYRIVATNEGLGTTTALSISDSLPAYTLFSAGPVCSVGTASYTAPVFACTGISLAPSQTATLEFRVRVRP